MPTSTRVAVACSLLCSIAHLRAQGETTLAVPLEAAPGWNAERIHKSDGGVWYARIDKVVDSFGANEVIVGDDKGRLLLLSVYSGQWTAHHVVCDGQWLAPTCSSDVDPRVPGRELYAAGKSGSVHRVVLVPEPFARFRLASREIGHAAGEEFHAVVAADLEPGGPAELLAFGISGACFQLVAEATGEAFSMRLVATLPGRVRDVVVEPGAHGAPARLYAVARSGDWLRLQLHDGRLHQEVLRHEDCGLGRIAMAKQWPGVFYLTRDDGLVLRLRLEADGRIVREPIFAGGQGLRGVAAGRFFADGREAIAVYGYDRTVRLVSRVDGGAWQAETVFVSAQRGHWLAVGELDGRNGTDELVATGFDGDVVLLARPPGHALPGVALPAPAPALEPEPAPRLSLHRLLARWWR